MNDKNDVGTRNSRNVLIRLWVERPRGRDRGRDVISTRISSTIDPRSRRARNNNNNNNTTVRTVLHRQGVTQRQRRNQRSGHMVVGCP